MKKLIALGLIIMLTGAGGLYSLALRHHKAINKPQKRRQVSILQPKREKSEKVTFDVNKVIDKNKKIELFKRERDDRAVIVEVQADIGINVPKKEVNIKLFSLTSGEVYKELNLTLESELFYVDELKGGFCVVQEDKFKKKPKLIWSIYDDDLNLTKTADMSSILIKYHLEPVLSNDGTKAAFIAYEDKYCYVYLGDLELKNTQKIYESFCDKVNSFSSFDNIAFTNDDKKIAFTGKEYINEDEQPSAIGIMGLDGSSFKYIVHDGIGSSIGTGAGKTFFNDAQIDYKKVKHSSGQVFVIDNATDDIQQYDLKDKDESQIAFISKGGNYIITKLIGKLQSGEPIYRFRVYDVRSKEMIKQFDETLKGCKSEECYAEFLMADEDVNSIYVCYGVKDEIKVSKYKLK